MPLTKEEVLEKMKEPNVVVLNVLPEIRFKEIHIKGSFNLTLGQNIRSFSLTALKKYGKKSFFITYCADGESTLAFNAAKVLREAGLQAENYPGGSREWSQAGFPTGRG